MKQPSTVTLNAPEVRTYPAAALQVVEADVDSTLSELHGMAVPYGIQSNVGWYRETIRAGAFNKSIREAAKGLPLLLWHDNQSWPIGRSSSFSSEQEGLYGVWALDDSPDAQRAARQARDGFLVGMSIGFQPIANEWTYVDWEDWNPEAGVVDSVERIEARLLEVSLTPTPAYAGAQVALVRSAGVPEQVREHRKRAARPGELAHWREVLEQLRAPERFGAS